ncbi:MAG: DUF3299 domain-containing protein [Opitutaceae bacterium]|nr:DUF3299 domain-containing protein [Opitutaceae bacterium]
MATLALTVSAAGLRAQIPEPPPDKETMPREVIDGEEVYTLGFQKLAAFEYVIYDDASGATPEQIATAKKTDQIPAWVRSYDNQRVALTGYMLPLKVENGLTAKFIMMRDISTCCFGNIPNMNEYLIVTMTTGGVKPVQDVPTVLIGVFKIREIYENGYLTSIFQMDGEKFLGVRP